jgi:hypothetical protein
MSGKLGPAMLPLWVWWVLDGGMHRFGGKSPYGLPIAGKWSKEEVASQLRQNFESGIPQLYGSSPLFPATNAGIASNCWKFAIQDRTSARVTPSVCGKLGSL